MKFASLIYDFTKPDELLVSEFLAHVEEQRDRQRFIESISHDDNALRAFGNEHRLPIARLCDYPTDSVPIERRFQEWAHSGDNRQPVIMAGSRAVLERKYSWSSRGATPPRTGWIFEIFKRAVLMSRITSIPHATKFTSPKPSESLWALRQKFAVRYNGNCYLLRHIDDMCRNFIFIKGHPYLLDELNKAQLTNLKSIYKLTNKLGALESL